MGSVSTPVRDEPPTAASEELVLGPRPRRALPRWFPVAALLVGVLVVAAAAVWRFWPRPVEPLSLAELQNTYAGMVRADGTNDASVITQLKVPENRLTVTPAECGPLVEMTMANRFPAGAPDGVSTYWVGGPSTISLFTLRFVDAATATAERDRLGAAVDRCAGQRLQARRPGESPVGSLAGAVSRIPDRAGADDQVGYLLTTRDGITAIQLMTYENTLTWEYRYESGSTSYSPLAADQLLSSLRSQLDAVVAARPR